MANVRKRISELTALTSASLDTTLVGVDGGTTYKIELDTLADAVTSRVNILDRDRLNSLESVTSSFETKGRSVISSSTQITSYGFISESVDITSLNSFTSSQLSYNTAFTNGISSRLTTSSFDTFSQSVDSRIIAATNEQSFNGLISGSSQLTSSYDDRYVLSGSITQTTWDNISGKPNGLVSQSTDLTSLNSFTSSQESLNTVLTNGISSRLTTSSFNEYVASQSTSSLVDRLNTIENVSASWITESETGSFLTSLSGAISSSSQLTSSYDTRYVLSGSITQTTWDNIASKPSGIISGSSQLPIGLISGSSQLTASYDTRYTLSGSVVSGTTPAGTISGSSQLTSSFDGRYTQTGSFNTLTTSFNSFTASAQSVTTGSNSFNGTQTITGSLIITTGSFIGSQITANTASLYLTSGSNMYVQNNGVVEITGSLKVSGSTMFATAGGDEGGEIQFGIPTTNTTLQNRVTVDVWQNRLRIFEGSADAKGVFIDLSKPTTGNNNEITYKASGIVNAGTFVTLDNIKATVTTSGQRGLSLATVSGTFDCNIGGNFAGAVVGASGYGGTATITTTPSTSIFGWGFTAIGDMANYIITDTTNSRAYRIIIQIGNAFNNNLVSIERLH
jgi:hypothetical protein